MAIGGGVEALLMYDDFDSNEECDDSTEDDWIWREIEWESDSTDDKKEECNVDIAVAAHSYAGSTELDIEEA